MSLAGLAFASSRCVRAVREIEGWQRGSAATSVVERQRPANRVDADAALFSAALLTTAAAILLQLRFEWATDFTFAWLYWNLALAWVPYVCSVLALWLQRRNFTWLLLLVGGIALLFLPNAPYLATDFIHLRSRADAPEFFDASLLLAFAAAGWFLGLVSMHIWRSIIEVLVGQAAGRAFLVLAAFASGFGVYLGRVDRWNSWDPVRRPGRLVVRTAHEVLAPQAHPQMVWITLAFGALLLLTYWGWTSHLRRSEVTE